jgi:hypothetical protein
VIRRWAIRPWGRRWLIDDPNVYNHVVSEVFVLSDEGISLLILEAHAFGTGGPSIEAIEILDRCDNRVGSIMREDLHTHREARTILGGFREEELECDTLRCRAPER